MGLLLISFFAGMLTVLAPCVLPLLPIILGTSIGETENKKRPYVITASLGLSIIIFSILLKATTLFITINPIVWKVFSGVILILFGIITIFPNLWKNISTKLGFSDKSNQLLGKSGNKKGILGDILVGFSLGPVFSSCSPTYALILAVILPASFDIGLLNLFAYVLGLALILLLIAILGQSFIKKIGIVSNPNGVFKKLLGIIFFLVGLAIIFGVDKKLEAYIIDIGYLGTINFEQSILDKVKK